MAEEVREASVGVERVNGSALDGVREVVDRRAEREVEDRNGEDVDVGRSSSAGGNMPSSVYRYPIWTNVAES